MLAERNALLNAAARQVKITAIRSAALLGESPKGGWSAEISEDASRVHLSGGSVSLDLGLSAEILHYIEDSRPAG